MIRILLVDDSNDKVASVVTAIREIYEDIFIYVVIDFISAQEYLKANQVDLLILDINLPIRMGEEPSFDIGKKLLDEISRKRDIKTPYYILGLTQYLEALERFSEVWPIIKYSPDSVDWKVPVTTLVKHILRCGLSEFVKPELKPTIFLEGNTDKRILVEAISLFQPELLERITIKSETGAGASWVARQIIVWAHLLQKNGSNYIPAIGLMDGDNAAKNANDEIKRVVKENSAESKTFKIFKLSASYARHIIPIKQKGLELPVTLEEMYVSSIWIHAKNQNWLEVRTNADRLLTNPESWNKYDLSLKDHLTKIGLTEEESLFVSTVKDDCKDKLVNYVINLPTDEKKVALSCFAKLISDLSAYLLPTNSLSQGE